MRIEQIIKNAYYNPKTGFQSSAKLYKKLKIKYPEITHSKLSDVINAQQTHQIHTISKLTTEHYNQTKALGFGEIQMDLLDLSVYKSQNNGYRYILMAVDIYSRKLFTRPLKTKNARETLNATIEIKKEMEPIKIESIVLDKGKEYNNSLFKTHFKEPAQGAVVVGLRPTRTPRLARRCGQGPRGLNFFLKNQTSLILV